MSHTDPVADLLTRIRNAHHAKHDRVDVPASQLKSEICRLLKDEGFVRNVRQVDDAPVAKLRVFLRYDELGQPAISHLERVSKPGRRVYKKAEELKPVRNGLGVGVISTSKGLLSDRQAREQGIGGEVLCEVW